MGKAWTFVPAAALLIAAAVLPHAQTSAHAQSAVPPASCSGTFSPSPMQGHYSGAWHSDGDYHFSVWNTDLRLQIIIDGTVSASVSPNGSVTGSVSGTVNAPITHDGITDVSSGHGTISGSLAGTLTPAGTLLVLHAPIIDMHWGTFVGGGYTVEKFITMPDYTFSVGSLDCISASGTISEQNFPTMAIVADGGNMMTYAPGIGPATGTWNLTADKASQYAALSSRVDSFIASATAVLDTPGPLTASTVDRQIAAPLKSLVADIRADPDTARCLLERLASWEASAEPALLGRVPAYLGSDSLSSLRDAGDALRGSREIDVLCNQSSNTAGDAVSSALAAALSHAVDAKRWADVALLTRETLLLGLPVQPALSADLHSVLGTTSGSSGLVEVTRVAYAFGDDADAGAAYARLSAKTQMFVTRKKTRPHHKHKPVKATPKPTARPTPSPTPAPKPTLNGVLMGGVAAMHLTVAGATAAWPGVAGAASYVVTVTGASGLMWSWAGPDTGMQLGDTTVQNLPETAADIPPVLEPSGATWAVLALDAKGTIVGATFRVKP